MKGKISMYYNAPNVSKVRTRIDKPSKELTRQLRDALHASAIEVLNENMLSMRAKMIEKFSKLGVTVKDKRYLDQLQNVMNPYFDATFQATPFSDADDSEESEENEAGDAEPAEKKEEDFD